MTRISINYTSILCILFLHSNIAADNEKLDIFPLKDMVERRHHAYREAIAERETLFKEIAHLPACLAIDDLREAAHERVGAAFYYFIAALNQARPIYQHLVDKRIKAISCKIEAQKEASYPAPCKTNKIKVD